VVKKGQAVLWAEAEDLVDGKKVHQLVSFFSVSEGKRLEPGDKVYIELSTVEAQEQGMLEGSVAALSSYAISRYRMGQDIHNENLIAYLMSGQEAVVRCDITLSSHPDDPKRYLWTTGYGPDEEVSSGNVATVRGVVEGNRPIDFVFPMWRLRRLQQ
jgi:HlyD family secretion protein